MRADTRMETASPAASSAGEVIFEPEDKRASDLASMLEESASKLALLNADMFVLITMITLSVSHPVRGYFWVLCAIHYAWRTFEGVHRFSPLAL